MTGTRCERLSDRCTCGASIELVLTGDDDAIGDFLLAQWQQGHIGDGHGYPRPAVRTAARKR